jgi:hypothetical protein
MLGQQFDQAGIVRQYIDRPRLDFLQHARVEILDLEGHAPC